MSSGDLPVCPTCGRSPRRGFWDWMHGTTPKDILLALATVASTSAAIMGGCNANKIEKVEDRTHVIATQAEDAAEKAKTAADVGIRTNVRVKSVESAVNDLWLEGAPEPAKGDKK